MLELSNGLRESFERDCNLFDADPFQGVNLISFHDVLKAHYLIADYFITEGEEVIYGIKDVNLLGSALGRQLTGFGNYSKWKKSEEICATLFYGLIKDHAFHDANKRTALLSLLYHLDKFGKTVNAKQKEFEDLAVNVANNDYEDYSRFKKFEKQDDSEVLFIADFIRRNTRNIDKRYYTITYQELNRLLKNHDCWLDGANGAFINVMQRKKKKGFLGIGVSEKVVKVLQIGFPGWKRQINSKALKEVLKATELTEENGVDSQAFFNGAEPLYRLIDEYRGPLKRLKNR